MKGFDPAIYGKLSKLRKYMTKYYPGPQHARALSLAQCQQHQASQQAQAMYNSSTTATTWWSNSVTTSTATTTAATLANNVMNSLYAAQGTIAWAGDSALVRDTLRLMGECAIADGEACIVRLPDGAYLVVDPKGNYRIEDKDAKVTYRANRLRDFNSFVNASDKLESFINFCGTLGVRQEEMLNIPIKLFIGWLIIEAAAADGEGRGNDVELLEGIFDYVKPRCNGCGRFISRRIAAKKITFCRPVCLERELEAA